VRPGARKKKSQMTSGKPKAARRGRVRARRGTPLWELLPDELVRRIVGFVRQRFMIGVYPSPVQGSRVMRTFKSTRLTNRALANGLHTVVLLSVPTYHPDHVDAFTEGLVRLVCDLYNKAQQEELGNAHVSFKHDFLKGTFGTRADHTKALREIVKRGWFQPQPQIFYADYQRAVNMHLRMLLPKGEIVLPTSHLEKQRVARFLTDVVSNQAQLPQVSKDHALRAVMLAMCDGEWDQ